MAVDFKYTNPEAAKQAIAQLQLQAALAENQSREAIAREQTQQQRAITQSQINENEKNRSLTREGYASQERWRGGSNAAANERANTQYQTILGEIKASGSDPMTKRELEARLAQFPQITEDLANNLRSERDIAYNLAKNAYDMGEQLAANYRTELAGKKPTDYALPAIYERIGKDKSVVFDRAAGTVRSAFPMPRVDAAVTQNGILGAYKPGGVFPPSDQMQGLGTIPTIGDMKAKVTGVPAGVPVVAPRAISPAQDYGGAAGSVQLSAISPMQDYGGAAVPSISPAQDYGAAVLPTGYDREYLNEVSPPPLYGPPNRRLTDFAVPLPTRPIPPFMDMSQPYRQPSIYDLYGPPNNMPFMGNDFPPRVRRSTDFAVPPYMQTLPRLWDMQNIRPEFRPPMDYYQQ